MICAERTSQHRRALSPTGALAPQIVGPTRAAAKPVMAIAEAAGNLAQARGRSGA